MTIRAIPRVMENNVKGTRKKRILSVRRLQDYHTVQNTRKADGGLKDCHITYRQYLSDAAFGVVIEGSEGLLQRIADAVGDPKWGIWLGRKACVPSAPVLAGLRNSRDEALKLLISDEPLESFTRQEDVDSFDQGTDTLADQPLSFAIGQRQFARRRIRRFQAGQ
jgi:CRISPR system Cascade subunit CasD